MHYNNIRRLPRPSVNHMAADDPTEILRNAKLAAGYASSRGMVGDLALLDRLASLQQKKPADLSAADQQDLNKITNVLMNLVKPTTIDELRTSEAGKLSAVFSFLTRRWGPPISVPGSIFAICFLIILVIIPLTTLFNRLSISIAELRETEQQDFFSVVYQARTLWLDKTKPQSAQDLQSSVKKLREMQSKINGTNLTINATVDLQTGAPKWLSVVSAAYGLGSSSLPISRAAQAEVPATAYPPSAAASSPSAADTSAATTPKPACPKDDEVCLDRQFTSAYGLAIGPDDISGAYLNRRQAESAAALLGGSMLPVLYGLLGASVYLLRRYLGEGASEPDSNFGMRAYLRLGLGGIAGLAIGWFWSPTSAKAAMDVANLTTAPFALAFVAGFSIELLFSILDRILAAVNPNTSGAQNKNQADAVVPKPA